MKLGRLLLIGRFKKRKRRRKEIREFSFLKTNLGIEGEIFFWSSTHWRILCGRKAQTKREKTNCNQGCPGMFLVTLEIITHVRFLRVFFVSEYLM